MDRKNDYMVNTLLHDLASSEKVETGFLKGAPMNLRNSQVPSMQLRANTRNSTSPFGNVTGFPARWRDDPGPIGKAIRNNNLDPLRDAIRNVKKRAIR